MYEHDFLVGASCARDLAKDVNTYKRKPNSKPKTKLPCHKTFHIGYPILKFAGRFNCTYSLYVYEHDSHVGASVFAGVFLSLEIFFPNRTYANWAIIGHLDTKNRPFRPLNPLIRRTLRGNA